MTGYATVVYATSLVKYPGIGLNKNHGDVVLSILAPPGASVLQLPLLINLYYTISPLDTQLKLSVVAPRFQLVVQLLVLFRTVKRALKLRAPISSGSWSFVASSASESEPISVIPVSNIFSGNGLSRSWQNLTVGARRANQLVRGEDSQGAGGRKASNRVGRWVGRHQVTRTPSATSFGWHVK
jgi:hypothetical protein